MGSLQMQFTRLLRSTVPLIEQSLSNDQLGNSVYVAWNVNVMVGTPDTISGHEYKIHASGMVERQG